MMNFKIKLLQWGAGSYCAFSGLLMLVAPQQFFSPGYAALQPLLWLWGLFFLLAGSTMLSVALLTLSRGVTILAHLLAGTAMLLLAAGFVAGQLWSGTINLSVLGLGTVLAALPALSATRGSRVPARDLLSLLVGLGMIGNGTLMVLAPTQYKAPVYLPLQPILGWFGLAYVVGGALLVYQQLRPAAKGADSFGRIAQLLGGAILFLFLPFTISGQIYSGIPYYGLIAVLIATLPFHARLRRGIDSSALRTRLALAMALVAAVPLILMTAWYSGRTEQDTRQAALTNMQTLATALASSVQNYANEHRNAVLTLAASPDLLTLPPAAQHSLLQGWGRAYPDIVAFSTYEPGGKPIARSDSRPLTALLPTVLTRIQAANGLIDMVIISPLLHRPVFVFAVPMPRLDGGPGGFVVLTVESASVSASLASYDTSAGSIVYLVDTTGRVIAHPDAALVAKFADLSATAPVAALLAHPAAGAISYGAPATEQLAGYATVPGLGWGVIIVQPVATALTATRTARLQLLLLVVIFLVVAAVAGVLLARGLTAPLSALVAATTALAADDQSAPLPASGIREVDSLAAAFGEMRERIAARTAERKQAQVALQTLNGELDRLVTARTAELYATNVALEQKARALEVSNSELAQFAYVASHDLQEPLRMMASYSQLLARRYHGQIDAKADKYIDYISEGANRMKALIDDLLVYTRLGHESNPLQQVSVEDALNQALDNLQLVIAESATIVRHDTLPAAMGDGPQLTLIFQNLIQNAIKFHDVRTPVVTVSARRRNGYWDICVRDNGIGIELQYQERIFTIFQRLHTRQNYQGNGIGLAIVKKMVEHHGGRIWVESTPGEGAAFFFTVQALKELA